MTSGARAMRPLLVAHSGDPGGSNEVVLSLLRHRPPRVEPACLFLADGPAVARARDLAPTEVFPAGPARHVWRAPRTVAALRDAARRHGADVVFAHVRKAHLYAAPAARLLRLPYLWWEHDPPSASRGVRLAARLPADRVVCSSDFTARHQRRLASRPPVVTVYPGIEADGDRPVAPHDPSSPPVVGAVGRLRRYKRHELLLRAAPLVRASRPDVRFRIVGATTPGTDEDYGAELEALAGELGVADALELPGFVSDAGSAMHTLSVLVHAAEDEPFGLVVVEALLQGVPVICPRQGGPAEIVRDGVDGVHAEVEDPRRLAEAIVELVEDPARRRRMGEHGRERVRSSFTAERMAAEAWRVVAEVAGA